MMKYYLIIFFFIGLTHSNAVDQDDCPLCQFDEYFNRENGYGCYRKSVQETICTCPDRQQPTINQPCRICNRVGICGSQDVTCTEKSAMFNSSENGAHFACLCTLDSYVIGKKCSEETSVTTVLISTTTTPPGIANNSTLSNTSTTGKASNTTTTPTGTKCDNRSSGLSASIKLIQIALLNLVYFLNK